MFDSIPPGVALASKLDRLDLASASSTHMLEAVDGWERLISWAQARQVEAMAAFAHDNEESISGDIPGAPKRMYFGDGVTSAVALKLHLSPVTSERRLWAAWELDGDFAATLSALRAGDITMAKARILLDETLVLDVQDRPEVESAVLGKAAALTPGELRRLVKRAVLTVDPQAAEKRRAAARANRRLVRRAEDDGMGSLKLSTTAEDVLITWHGLTALAEAAKTEGDERTLDTRRADALVDLVRHAVHCGCHAGAGCTQPVTKVRVGKPAVHVTVAATTLAGLDDLPASLAGHGPIPAGVARLIAADADWRRVLTDPITGAVRDVDRTRYSPPASMREYVEVRDQTCRFPGCLRAAERCDLDHTVAYPNGPTAVTNLAALCRRHHRLKQDPDWLLETHPHLEGVLTWNTPTGHSYVSIPPDVHRAA